MAKRENKVELTAGLTEGLTFDKSQAAAEEQIPEVKGNEVLEKVQNEPVGVNEMPASETAQPAAEETAPDASSSKGLAAIYADKMQMAAEARTVRIQAVVTQSTAQKLDELVSARKIKSKNDLINFLLERYLETMK